MKTHTHKRTTPLPDAAVELDLSEKTLRRDVISGAPHARSKGRILFDVAELQRWRTDHGLTGRPGRPGTSSPELTEARIRKERSLASLYELRVAKERGLLWPAADVKVWSTRYFTTARDCFLNLGDELTPALEGRDAPERAALINARVREILTDLSGQIGRMGEDVTANEDGK